MLGIILLFWIGKKFFKLAENYEKSKWGFTILGIVTYYAGTLLFAVILLVLVEVFSSGYLDDVNDRVIDLICMPFGLLSCYILYKYLDKIWKKNDPRVINNIEQIGK